MSLVKYRVKEVAADFGVAPKVIAEVMGKFFEKPKSNAQVLTEEELNVIFDYMTQHNQIKSLEVVFAVAPKERPAPKAEPVKEAAPAPVSAPAVDLGEEVDDEKAQAIRKFLSGLLEQMGSQAVPHCVKADENTYKVELVGEDLGYLIGRRGDTLDAIQHLANYAVNRSIDGHVRINVDAESYREKREDSLRRYARKKAQQVLKARRRTTLEPMNAYERHVIHAALQDMENITTHSTGTEPNRRVVIEYVR